MKKHQNASRERVQETKDGREMKANGGGGVTLGYQTDQKLCAVVKEETKKDNV